MVLHHSMADHAVEVHAEVVDMVVARHHHLIHGDRDPCQGPGPGLGPLRRPHVVVDTARAPPRTHAADRGLRRRLGVEEVDVTMTITLVGAVQAVIVMVEVADDEAHRGIGDAIVEGSGDKAVEYWRMWENLQYPY